MKFGKYALISLIGKLTHEESILEQNDLGLGEIFLELNYGSFSKKIESVGLSCQKLVFLFLALKLAQKRPKTVARILRPNFFGFDTYKLHVKHSRLLLTKKGPRNDTRSPTITIKNVYTM